MASFGMAAAMAREASSGDVQRHLRTMETFRRELPHGGGAPAVSPDDSAHGSKKSEETTGHLRCVLCQPARRQQVSCVASGRVRAGAARCAAARRWAPPARSWRCTGAAARGAHANAPAARVCGAQSGAASQNAFGALALWLRPALLRYARLPHALRRGSAAYSRLSPCRPWCLSHASAAPADIACAAPRADTPPASALAIL
jgi:hypothetical protein